MSIFLVVCAILFYTPRAIWLMAEGGLMKYLAKGATTKIVEDADKKREALLKTFQVHNISFHLLVVSSPECLENFANVVLTAHNPIYYLHLYVVAHYIGFDRNLKI